MISFKALDANGELINSKMKPFTYPAGEVSLKFSDNLDLQKNEIAIIQPDRESLHTDIFQYMMWEGHLSIKDSVSTLVIPYVPGAREDRGEVFGLEQYLRTITQYFLGNLVIFDPHSIVTKERLDWHTDMILDDEPTKVHIMTVADLVRQRPWAFEGYDYVIAPDEGATERAQSVADVLGVPVVQFKKMRDFESGKILGIEPVEELDLGAKHLVVDDICDGGGTFLGLAESSGLLPTEVDLYVSHGVFSKGTAELEKKFGRIITTNSYLSDAVLDGVLRKNGVEVLDVIHPMIDLIK